MDWRPKEKGPVKEAPKEIKRLPVDLDKLTSTTDYPHEPEVFTRDEYERGNSE